MTKSHIVDLAITNGTGTTLNYSDDWFDSGRLADGNSWPASITSGATAKVRCYEKDASAAGCSGWVKYQLGGVSFYFCFSNPVYGPNGIDIGTSTSVWNSMTGHYDCPVKRALFVQDSRWLVADILSSGGDDNQASWNLTICDTNIIYPSNLEVRDVESLYASFPTTSTRRQYYRCNDAPTSATGLAQSHFKGIASFAGKLIFTHTNLDVVSTANGKYLIGDKIDCGNQGTTEGTFDTLHQGWSHPGAAQACGSFMAMGIQKSASGAGSEVSQIQIYDIRMAQVNQPIKLLGSIERTNIGINGVAITKKSGAAGRYIVAGVNGGNLTVYRSTSPSLITNGVPTVEFVQVLQRDDFDASGAGLALVTQQGDGTIFLIALNADEGNVNSKMSLYQLDLQQSGPTCFKIQEKDMPVTDMSDLVTLLQRYMYAILPIPIIGPLLNVLLATLGAPLLNSSLRWGKGLAITSPDTIEIFASDRNVLPLSSIPVVGSDKDFSLLVWTNAAQSGGLPFRSPVYGIYGINIGSAPAMAEFGDKLYIAFQANDSSHALFVTSTEDGTNWKRPAVGYGGIAIGSAPAMAQFNGRLYVAFQANDSSHALFVTSSADGTNFTTPAVGYGGIAIGSAPAMAAFNGRLYVAFQANDSSHRLFVTSSADGTNFTTPAVGYGGIQIGSAPAMAQFNGRLYVVFQANDFSHALFVTSSPDGTNFTTPVVGYGGIQIGSAPTVAQFNGRLYVAFQANDSSQTLSVTSSADGTNWTTPAANYTGLQIGSAPALGTFQNYAYVIFQANDSSHELCVSATGGR